MPSPVNIDPNDKAMIDALVEVSERQKSRRAWSFWLFVGGASLAALWCARYDFIPDLVRLTRVVVVPMSSVTPNRAAHPEPLKRRTLWHSLYRRPGGRER